MGILEQRLSVVTLGVKDLARATEFYAQVLGWTPDGDTDAIAMFDLGGYVLSLYPHRGLADDIGVERGEPGGPYHGFTLAYNTRSREEVDRIFADLETRGVTILKQPAEVFWGGYSGYFADPDGHAWEVAHNPFWTIGGDGRMRRP